MSNKHVNDGGGMPFGRPRGGMQGGGQKPRDIRKTLGELLTYCKPQLPIVVVALLCAAFGALLTLVGPDRLREITDLITAGMMSGIDLKAIVSICVFLLVIYVLSAFLGFSQGYLMATATQKISKRLRSDVSGKINRLPICYFNKTAYGDVLSRVTNDVDSIGQALNQSVGTFVSALTLFLGSLLMMFLTNVWMAGTAVATTLSGFFLMRLIMSRSQKYFASQQRNLGAMNGYIEEIYTGHDVVKIYSGEQKAKAEFEEINNALCDSAFKSQFFSGLMMPLMGFIGNFAYVAVCVVGALLVTSDSISFGVIVAFMLYVRFFTQPLAQLAQVATAMQSAAAASERVFEFLAEEEMEEEVEPGTRLTNVRGEVEFRNVRFGYEGSETTVIHNFCAKAAPGEKIAIVGPTGAGKTTIVNLLMRFHEIQSGEILIDGVPIRAMNREHVHALFCMVLQDTWLFEGSIRENLIFAQEGITDEEMVRVCKAVGIHHLIKTLPKGYDTILDEETSLSVGEKQQLTIARAMIENAPMLILDEATSSVDTRTEVLIQRAMDQLMEGRTCFVIAHRLSTIKNADLILVMKDGDIIESGRHEELLQQAGFYAELYNSQFENDV